MSSEHIEWPWLNDGKSVMCHLFTRERSQEVSFEAFNGPRELIGLVVAPTENNEAHGTPPDVIVHEGRAFIHYDIEIDIDDRRAAQHLEDVLRSQNIHPHAAAAIYLESSTFTATRENVVAMKKTAP